MGSIAWYVRWQDKWSQSHAAEEFRLKRLDLDIDRASWLVEMMLEWKEEKGSEISSDLIAKLGHGLFEESGSHGTVRHPNEELLAAVIAAANGVRVNVPGIGMVDLNTKSLRKVVKTLDAEAKED